MKEFFLFQMLDILMSKFEKKRIINNEKVPSFSEYLALFISFCLVLAEAAKKVFIYGSEAADVSEKLNNYWAYRIVWFFEYVVIATLKNPIIWGGVILFVVLWILYSTINKKWLTILILLLEGMWGAILVYFTFKFIFGGFSLEMNFWELFLGVCFFIALPNIVVLAVLKKTSLGPWEAALYILAPFIWCYILHFIPFFKGYITTTFDSVTVIMFKIILFFLWLALIKEVLVDLTKEISDEWKRWPHNSLIKSDDS